MRESRMPQADRHADACPPWCDQTSDHEALDSGRLHERHMGGFWLRELRSGTGRVMRKADDLIEVALELDEHDGNALDPVVTLRRVTIGREMRLTSGEARSLAAILTAAADHLDGVHR